VKYSNELKVGIAIVLSFILMILGVRFLQNLPLLHGAYDLWAEFDDVGGLMAGNAVRLKGYQVGTVGDIQLDTRKQTIRVRMHINEDVQIPRGSKATIGGFTALSSVYVEIIPGPPGNPPLQDGDTLYALNATDPLEMIMEKSGPLLSRTDSLLLYLTGASASLHDLLRRPDSDLRGTLAGLRASVTELEQLLHAERGRVAHIVRNLEATSLSVRSFTETHTDSLSLMITEARKTLQQLDASLEEVQVLSRALTAVVVKLQNGEGTLGRMLQDESLYEHLDSLIINLNHLSRELREDPGKYLKELNLFSIF